MDEFIAPCPFCGNAAQSRLDAIKDVDAWVYCDACSACGPTKATEAEAIAAWNRVGAVIEAAREAVAESDECLADAARDGETNAYCSMLYLLRAALG